MEIIHSPTTVYIENRSLYDSAVCETFLGKDNDGVTVLINRVKNGDIIREYLNAFDSGIKDFIESFIFGESFYIVFRYHEGIPISRVKIDSAANLVKLCLDICTAAAVCDVPEHLLCLIDFGQSMVLDDGFRVHINKAFVFNMNPIDPKPPRPIQETLASLQLGIIRKSGLNPVQIYTLEGLRKILSGPHDSLLSLFCEVRDFSESYQPFETKEFIKTKISEIKARVSKAAEKVSFWVATLTLILASVFAIIQLLSAEPEDDKNVLTQAGGIDLNERGALEGWYFDKEDHH